MRSAIFAVGFSVLSSSAHCAVSRADQFSNFIIDHFEGTETVEDCGSISRFGVNQAAHPEIIVSEITRGQALDVFRTYWRAVGESAPRGQEILYLDTAINMGVARAKSFILLSAGDATTLVGYRIRWHAALIAAFPKKFKRFSHSWSFRDRSVALQSGVDVDAHAAEWAQELLTVPAATTPVRKRKEKRHGL